MKGFDRGMALAMIYVVVLPVAATLLINMKHWPALLIWFNTETGAAWVQGVASVAAIGASFWIATSIDQRGADRQSRDREASATARFAAGRSAVVLAETATKRVLDELWVAENDPELASLVHARRLMTNAGLVLDYYIEQPHDSPSLVFALFAARQALAPIHNGLAVNRAAGSSWKDFQHEVMFARAQIEQLLIELDNGVI